MEKYPKHQTIKNKHQFVDAEDRFHTFNMGIGWVAIVSPDQVEQALTAGPGGTVIGTMREGKGIKVTVRK